MVQAAISWYCLGPFITLHGQIIAREYVDSLDNQVLPVIQTLIQDNDADFQDNNFRIHIFEIVQSSFEKHEINLYHLT
jgi:hypothetical protein